MDPIWLTVVYGVAFACFVAAAFDVKKFKTVVWGWLGLAFSVFPLLYDAAAAAF